MVRNYGKLESEASGMPPMLANAANARRCHGSGLALYSKNHLPGAGVD